MMKKLASVLFISCEKATELIDKKSVAGLSIKEKLFLHFHLGVCDACITYQKQSKVLDDLLRKHIGLKDETKVPQNANNDLKRRIISKL
jgi:hypothetical protein